MRKFVTNLESLYRKHPVSTLLGFVAGAVTGGVVSALLFHSDGYTTSAAVGRGAAVAALTYAGLLAIRWATVRLADRWTTSNAAGTAVPRTDDAA